MTVDSDPNYNLCFNLTFLLEIINFTYTFMSYTSIDENYIYKKALRDAEAAAAADAETRSIL